MCSARGEELHVAAAAAIKLEKASSRFCTTSPTACLAFCSEDDDCALGHQNLHSFQMGTPDGI